MTPRACCRQRQRDPGASGPKRYQIGIGLSFGMSFEKGCEINPIQISRQFRLRRNAEKPWKDIPKDSPTRKRRALPERPSPSSATAGPIVSVQQAIWGGFSLYAPVATPGAVTLAICRSGSVANSAFQGSCSKPLLRNNNICQLGYSTNYNICFQHSQKPLDLETSRARRVTSRDGRLFQS